MNLLSVTEVAKILGVTRQTAWLFYKMGKFPSAQVVGHQIAIPMEDVEKYQSLLKEAS